LAANGHQKVPLITCLVVIAGAITILVKPPKVTIIERRRTCSAIMKLKIKDVMRHMPKNDYISMPVTLWKSCSGILAISKHIEQEEV
jgi:hypothetical protein